MKFIVIVAVFVVCIFGRPQDDKNGHLNNCIDLLKKGTYKDAVECASSLIKSVPNTEAIMKNLTEAAKKESKPGLYTCLMVFKEKNSNGGTCYF